MYLLGKEVLTIKNIIDAWRQSEAQGPPKQVGRAWQ